MAAMVISHKNEENPILHTCTVLRTVLLNDLRVIFNGTKCIWLDVLLK